MNSEIYVVIVFLIYLPSFTTGYFYFTSTEGNFKHQKKAIVTLKIWGRESSVGSHT